MSRLAKTLADTPLARAPRKGPLPACEVYGRGDLEDFIALYARREAGEIWKAQQGVTDSNLGIETAIKNDHFRYHWSGKCGHWDHIRSELDAFLDEKDAA